MTRTLGELATVVAGTLHGDSALGISGVNSLDKATAGQIAFADAAHVHLAGQSQAAALLVPQDAPLVDGKATITVTDVRAAFAKLMQMFTPPLTFPKGVAAQAHIGEDVQLGRGVTIMPCAVVDSHAAIGDGVTLYPGVYVGQYARVGAGTVLHANVTVRERCVVGARCVVHSGAVLGADGFGFTTENGVHTKVPQVGNVVVEDDVEIGALVGIDRATMGSTVIGAGTKIDNLVHIGHNCVIGKGCLIVAQTGLSGSTTVGDNVTFGGQVGTVGHINIGGNSVYAARSGITNDMPEGVFCAGFPVQPHQEWLRMQVTLKRLPDMLKRLKKLERAMDELGKGGEN